MASLFRDTKAIVSKTFTISRSETTAAEKLKLPKGSRVIAIVANSTAASNAQTTATISIGTSATATEWVNAQDVKTTASGKGTVLYNGAGAIGVGALSADATVYAKYAETGSASNAGGPWNITIFFNPGYGQV